MLIPEFDTINKIYFCITHIHTSCRLCIRNKLASRLLYQHVPLIIEMCHLKTVGWGQTGHEVQGDMGLGTMGHRKRLQETSGSTMGRLVLITDRTRVDKLASIFFQGGPPEYLQQDLLSPLDPRVAGELGVVGPLKDVGSQGMRDEQAVW